MHLDGNLFGVFSCRLNIGLGPTSGLDLRVLNHLSSSKVFLVFSFVLSKDSE